MAGESPALDWTAREIVAEAVQILVDVYDDNATSSSNHNKTC